MCAVWLTIIDVNLCYKNRLYIYMSLCENVTFLFVLGVLAAN